MTAAIFEAPSMRCGGGVSEKASRRFLRSRQVTPNAATPSIAQRAYVPPSTPALRRNAKRGESLCCDAVAAPDSSSRGAPTDAGPRGAVMRHVEAFNRRDLEALLACMSDDCVVEGLAYMEALRGKQALRPFYRTLLARLPGGMSLVVDDITGDSPAAPSAPSPHGGAVGVIWHLELDGMGVPYGRGISFYRTNTRGQVSYIRESPEHVAKVPLTTLPMLSAAAPLLRALRPFAPSLFGDNGGGANGTASGASAITRGAVNGAAAATGGQRGSSSGANARVEAGGSGSDPSELRSRLEAARGELKRLEAQMAQVPAAEEAASQRVVAAAPAVQAFSAADGGEAPAKADGAPPRAAAAAPSAGAAAAADGGARVEETPSPGAPLDISGVWLKDEDATDMAAYSKCLDLMRLGGLQKTAALKLFEGLQVDQGPRHLSVKFLTVVPFFKVMEEFTIGGTTTMPRRDLRDGSQLATVDAQPDLLTVRVEWGEPNAAHVTERYTMPTPGVLEVESTVEANKRKRVAMQVYRKAEGWQPRYSWPSNMM